MKKIALLILPVIVLFSAACEKKADNKAIEKCIEQIGEKVSYDGEKLYILTTLNVHNGSSVKMYTNHPVEIPAQDAVQISPNWDLANIKLYTNSDNEVKDYERDACETLYNLNLYITSHDLEIVHQYED